ncbi:unnamed protein product [Penicillium bialowiezense]
MSSSPRARSKSRASSVRAIARKSRDPAEWKPWFSPGFTVLGERLSESSEQSDRISLFSHFDSPPPAGIVQSTETEGRLRFTRTHLAREAHKKRRHQSTRATSEDVTLACGSPTPTVREPAKHRHKTPASWRLSMTKSVSVIPPLSPFSESLNPALFSDDHGELCSLSQFSQASSFPPPEQPREASRVSEVPSLSRSSTYYYSASPATGPRGASGESQSSFPGPSSPELAFNRQLSETLVPRSEKSRTLGSSPIPSQPFSPPIQYRDTTGAGSLGSTSGMIPNGAHSPLGLVSGHSLPNPGIREPSDGGVSKLGLRDLCSYIASGPPGVSQADICERWLKEKTSYLLESYKKILPTLWDEKDEMFQSRYKEREDLKKFCHRTAQEEMQDGLDIMRWGNSKPFHQPSPPANDRLAPAVAISSVNRHEGELRAARTANQFPEAIVSSGRNSEQGGRPALEDGRARGRKGTATSVVAATATCTIYGAKTGAIPGAATGEGAGAAADKIETATTREVEGTTDGSPAREKFHRRQGPSLRLFDE